MDVRIERGGSWARAYAGANRDRLFTLLDEVLSYPVPGAEWSEKYQIGVWDGRARLHNRPRGQGCVRFPAGMVDRVRGAIRRHGYRVDVCEMRPSFAPTPPLGVWRGPRPYRHQRRATEAVLGVYGEADNPKWPPGTILRLPVRSGKTLIAALVSHCVGLPVLFVVPSDHLLHQTREHFDEYLSGITIGQFAAGKRDLVSDVIIATPQTLTKALKTRHFQKLRKQRRLVIIDEVHHKGNEGEAWRNAALGLDPVFTLGLSATFEMSDDLEDATSTIWLRGICGPVSFSMTLSELIEQRYLVRPTIHWVNHSAPKMPRKARTGPQLYKEGIVECKERNEAIIRVAIDYASRGHRVLIDLERVGHTRAIAAQLRKKIGTRRVAAVVGSTSTSNRKKIIAGLRRGDIQIAIGTVLGEGVDIPELDVVINGEGGRGYIPTMQRFRCLTPAPGKKRAYLVDFLDDHHPKLASATTSRMDIYSRELAFRYMGDL